MPADAVKQCRRVVGISSYLRTGVKTFSMDYFKLSFLARLGLAILSGMVPSFLYLSDAFGSLDMIQDLHFSPYAISMGLLVLAPCIRAETNRIGRIVILVAASVANLAITYWLANQVFDFELGLFVAVALSTIVTCFATAVVAPIRITVKYAVYACIAGVVSATAFIYILFDVWVWLCFYACNWWNDLYFVGAWVAWYTVVFLAISFGQRNHTST